MAVKTKGGDSESCLLCAAAQLSEGDRFRVTYHSARSDEVQSAEGRVTRVRVSRYGSAEVVFRRDDDQKMRVEEDDRVHSYNSHRPTTGYAFNYQVIET